MDDDITSHGSSKFVFDSKNASQEAIDHAIYAGAFSYTKHYNILKMKYKFLALGWVLATFFAFSYVLSIEQITAPIDKVIALALVAIVSSRGVLLILILDAEIYHRLLEASFTAGLEMEIKGISQSKLHKNMIQSLRPEMFNKLRKKYEKSLSPSILKLRKIVCWIFTGDKENGFEGVFYDVLFYCGICFCLWIIAGISISTYLYCQGYPLIAASCGIATPFISFGIVIHIMRKSLKKTN